MTDEDTAQQKRRIRAALFGRGSLTREDAELLERNRASMGWMGRPSRGRTVLYVAAELWWVAVLVFALVRHARAGALIVPILFLVLGFVSFSLGPMRRRKIRQALT